MSDPFEVLGVSRDATEDQIKLAFRKLAMQYHPDRNQGDKAAEEKFKEINAAYEILKDPAARARAQNGNARGGNPHGDWHFTSADMSGFHGNFAGNFDDFFNDIMRQHRSRPMRNNDVQFGVMLTLEEALNGRDIEVQVQSGGAVRRVTVKIPPGVDTGNRLRVSGAGETVHQNAPPGDLYVTISVVAHNRFQRFAQNLLVDHAIDAFQAMLGDQIDIETLDGQTVRVTVPPGVQPGQRLRVTGHGMPVTNQPGVRGDLMVALSITIPTGLSDVQKDLLAQVRDQASA